MRYQDWLTPTPHLADDEQLRCRICGHYSVRRARSKRRGTSWVALVLFAAVLGYVTLDIVENGRLDGSILRMMRSEWVKKTAGHRPHPSAASRAAARRSAPAVC